ncbi:MAG TPA: YidC/Oxa1 family membrane protein insertase [Dictyoglomaceae bacterium]|nr:YidC/Oxa1 family membrane protein insertase [Dictyoglomaceae bacterium]HOL39989.1 YidC/Oxa1 family membrane protein insertase [Dictyoglomaceae bacterium]HOP95215.1 YidC/Oxa1 family membrane protein insertase [Dictyoglomaceae bacterium]HPP16579.1 YidC/Oxa1 family membrane protein insertase [Dictyoglomaceae bacterium]HPU43747.1 YidC/Oxa1 family membrane protein insertase [Dictyoglomaceae bacterium]
MIKALADGLGFLLELFYSWIGNYGLAIILLTIFVRIILYPLTHAQLKSILLQQKIQPEVKKIQEKFKDDPQAMNRELMILYQQYKINPMMGCLPLIIQFPILIALYQLLLNYKYTATPSFLWMSDLTKTDNILLILMGVVTYFSGALSSMASAPEQKKQQQITNIFTTVLFTFIFFLYKVPAGVMLYWVASSLFQLLQQFVVFRLHSGGQKI